MGSWAAQILHEHGGRVVAVSDAFGAIANEHGLPIPELRQHLADRHRCARLLVLALLVLADGGGQLGRQWQRWAGAAPSQAGAPVLSSRRSRRLPRDPPCSLASFPGGVVLPPEQLLAVPCDVLIPAAIGGVIDESNANDLQCKVGGTSAEGRRCWAGAAAGLLPVVDAALH